MTWRRGDAKAHLSTVIRAQSLANLGVSFTADETQTADCQHLLPGFQASEPQSKGVWELRMVGCTSAAGSRPKPHPRWPGTHADTMEEQACLSTRGRWKWTLFSNFLGRVRWTTDSPPGNTPCYLRRRDSDGLVLRRLASMAHGGD